MPTTCGALYLPQAPPPGPRKSSGLCSQAFGEDSGETLPWGRNISQVTHGIPCLPVLPPSVGVLLPLPRDTHLSFLQIQSSSILSWVRDPQCPLISSCGVGSGTCLGLLGPLDAISRGSDPGSSLSLFSPSSPHYWLLSPSFPLSTLHVAVWVSLLPNSPSSLPGGGVHLLTLAAILPLLPALRFPAPPHPDSPLPSSVPRVPGDPETELGSIP